MIFILSTNNQSGVCLAASSQNHPFFIFLFKVSTFLPSFRSIFYWSDKPSPRFLEKDILLLNMWTNLATKTQPINSFTTRELTNQAVISLHQEFLWQSHVPMGGIHWRCIHRWLSCLNKYQNHLETHAAGSMTMIWKPLHKSPYINLHSREIQPFLNTDQL